MCRRSRFPFEPQRGAILIIAIGILTLLAVLGATFANLMRLEKQATQNYIHSQEVDLINDAALEQVIAQIRGADNWYSFTSYRAPWIYRIIRGDDQGELGHGMIPVESDRVGDWEVLARKQKYAYRYKVKVIDTSAQLNLNGKQDTLGRMLENLGRAIEGSTRLHTPPYPLYEGPNRSGNRIRGEQIIQFRNKLEGNRFHSKTQLRELIGQENFETIKDFVTVESYVDPYTYMPFDGLNEIVEAGEVRSGGGARGIGGKSSNVQNPVENLSCQISSEPRSPVNINTAPEEVLIACLMGIACRRPFPYSHLNYVQIDDGASIGGQRIPGKEERDTLGQGISTMPRAVWVYSDRAGRGLSYENARALAQQIIAKRKNEPFRTWATSERTQSGGFAEFIYDLQDNTFPAPENAIVIDPAMPMNRMVDGDVRNNGCLEMTRMWMRGHDPRERTFRKEKGLPYHPRNAFFYDMIKAAVIVNANPNTRISRYNPNAPAWMPIDKSDLIRLDDRDLQTPRKGHTTEFCFDTNGIYEITALGEIAESAAAAQPPADEIFRSVYQKSTRTIVKVFDVLRHTNQFHFEKTFSTGDHSSRNNRRYIQTYPDPMGALTDTLSQGSKRDGNVQLAGLLDGRRSLSPPSARPQLYKTPESILMAMGLQDRTEDSYARLTKLNRGSQGFSDEVLSALDANYSKKGMGKRGGPTLSYNNMYTREELTGMGITYIRAFNYSPQLDTEQMGTDLYPDGFHQGIFTSTHLTSRFLLLPAHMMLGAPKRNVFTGTSTNPRAKQVGAASQAGRVEVLGNVPYYEGGLAFWVKFEFNGDDPVFSGLIGCTQVIEDVGQEPKDSEGSQFYIFKNTEGNLRIVRMYYHQCFDELASEDGAGGSAEAGSSIVLYPPVAVGEGNTGNEPGKGPPVDLDPKKAIARADYLIDVRNFRAHEWHHIAVDWNDNSQGSALAVYIDFERVREGGPYIPQQEVTENPMAWVRLNCRRPRDELFVGGFIRQQGVADAGVFKWITNSATASTGGSGLVPVSPRLKRVLANATIDELITYTGTFPTVRNYYGTGAPGYFSNLPGDYANVFEVPLPPEVDYVVLRSFDWTSYYPTYFTSREGQILPIISTPMQCQLYLGRTNVQAFFEPWRGGLRNVANPVAGRILMRRESKGLIGTNAELVYQFKLNPGKVQAGSLAGGAVHTPVLDDVTLTYYLPEPKILLQEEAE